MYHCTQGDVTADNSDSELCTGQSFGVRDEGYISMMQVENEEQKFQNTKDGKITFIVHAIVELECCLWYTEPREHNNHQAAMEEKKKYVEEKLIEERYKHLMLNRKILVHELNVKLQRQEMLIKKEKELFERKKFRAMVDAKVKELQKDMPAKREVQVIDLKRIPKYGLSEKQKREVDKIKKQLDKKIEKEEKKYNKKIKKIEKNKTANMEQRLQFEADNKLKKINKAKRKYNEEVEKHEKAWTKKWMESMQQRYNGVPACSSVDYII